MLRGQTGGVYCFYINLIQKFKLRNNHISFPLKFTEISIKVYLDSLIENVLEYGLVLSMLILKKEKGIKFWIYESSIKLSQGRLK